MDFYHAPGSSSQATHIMLREAGLAFRPHKVDIFCHTLADGSDYARINPNGYVPAIVLGDGTLMTESVAILDWLTDRAGSLQSGGETARLQHLQMLAFMSSELHKQFIPLFFSEDEAEQTRLRETVEPRLDWIGSRVKDTYLLGESFTGADAMLYVMLRWAVMVGIDYSAGLRRFIDDVERRDAVRDVLAAESLQPIGASA